LSVIAQGIGLALLFVYAGTPGVFSGASTGHPGAVFELGDGAPLLLVDGAGLVLKGTILIAGLLSTLMGIRFLEIDRLARGEFHAVLLFAVLGGMFVVSGTDFITLFVGLETMSLSVYLLVGWARDDRRSNEGALKYFLLGALAAGLLVYGMSLLYGATGSTNLFSIAAALEAGAVAGAAPLLLIGVLLIAVAVGFKMAAAPFHIWTPDAYEGAPTLVTAFMSTGVKTAAFGLALRIFLIGLAVEPIAWQWTVLTTIMCAVSVTLGNWVALRQDNVKRMLAYSSIAHAGYGLLGLVAVGMALSGRLGPELTEVALHWGQISVVLYMLAYTFTNVGAFALVAFLRREQIAGDQIEDFAGMAQRAPWYAAAMTLFMLSLVGIPATSGFIGKWYLFSATLEAGFGWLAVLAIVNSAVSLYYYMRVVVKMYMSAPASDVPYALTPAVALAVVLAVAGTLIIGLYPQPVLALVEATPILVP
jgi:NADH-quinone oxidoreductase subunit N